MAFESFEERYARQQKEREEQIQQQKLEQQLKFKKMFKTIGASVIGFILLVVLFNSCERIDAGYVGVGRGVSRSHAKQQGTMVGR